MVGHWDQRFCTKALKLNASSFDTDFTCAVESTVLLHGRMYITNRFICFYSNLFGLEKKIRIPYSHIRSITKENTAMVIPNAIAISTGLRFRVLASIQFCRFDGLIPTSPPLLLVQTKRITRSVHSGTERTVIGF